MFDMNTHESTKPNIANTNTLSFNTNPWDIDFGAMKFKMLGESKSPLDTESKIDNAIEEYRRFLSLNLMYPDALIVPNKIMDEVWHQHILDTKAYRQDCQMVFGYFLDHFPYYGIRSDEDKKNRDSSFDETNKLYKNHFGVHPSSLDGSACVQTCTSVDCDGGGYPGG